MLPLLLALFAGAAEDVPEQPRRREAASARVPGAVEAPTVAVDPARIDPRTGKDYTAIAELQFDLLKNSINEPLQPLSRAQYRWLRPSRHRLEPNPYANTDFTAYTLEFGEVKVGLASVTVGVLPRTQLGTVPLLDAAGIYNAHTKVNLLRIGGFDLAAKGAYHWLPLGDFDGTYLELGVFASQVLHPRLSVHGGANYTSMTAKGVPDFSKASPMITTWAGDLSQYNPPEEWFGEQAPRIRAEALTVRTAIDLRINRRDSFVLQGQALLRAAVVTELGDVQLSEVLPPIAGLDQALSYQGKFKVTDAYVASIAYQASWKQVDLRVGVGISSVPGAWALQANELSYRFGGPTRRTETRQRKTWRRNKRDVQPPGPAVAPPPLPEAPPSAN